MQKTYFIHGLNSLEVKTKVDAHGSHYGKSENKTSTRIGSNFFIWILVISLIVGLAFEAYKNSNSCINQNPSANIVDTNEAELELK